MSTRWFIRVAPVLWLGWALMAVFPAPRTFAQHSLGSMGPHVESYGRSESEHGQQRSGPGPDAWEGSAAGVAYSEQNHHIAGLLVVLMGFAELSHAMQLSTLRWARLLLPSAMLFAGLFVMIWSDHEAWPIGSLGFADTFFGHDPEIIQHKIYGILALTVGTVELFRRLGRMEHKAWVSPLPLMAIVGGLLLFGHSHGDHPAAHKIAMHHAIMGTMAITAGSSKLFSNWAYPAAAQTLRNWEWLWAGLILLIGAELLIYSE